MKDFYRALIALGVEKNKAKEAHEDLMDMLGKGLNPSNYWGYKGVGVFKECYFIDKAAVKFAVPANDTYMKEKRIYEKALDVGLGQIFAKSFFISIPCDVIIPSYYIEDLYKTGYEYFDYIIVQEKVDTILCQVNDKYSIYDHNCLPLHDENGDILGRVCGDRLTEITEWTSWIQAGIDYYGLDFMISIADFFKGQYICDTHSNNLGFRADGSPVIFDFMS